MMMCLRFIGAAPSATPPFMLLGQHEKGNLRGYLRQVGPYSFAH
jgi:hypothetical protein